MGLLERFDDFEGDTGLNEPENDLDVDHDDDKYDEESHAEMSLVVNDS
jgi:hypothetical protein